MGREQRSWPHTGQGAPRALHGWGSPTVEKSSPDAVTQGRGAAASRGVRRVPKECSPGAVSLRKTYTAIRQRRDTEEQAWWQDSAVFGGTGCCARQRPWGLRHGELAGPLGLGVVSG